jgi:hypothetical protein
MRVEKAPVATSRGRAASSPCSPPEEFKMTSFASGRSLLGGTASVLLILAAGPSVAQSLANKPCETKGAQEERIVDIEGQAFRVTYACIGHPPKLHWLSAHKTPVNGRDTLRR